MTGRALLVDCLFAKTTSSLEEKTAERKSRMTDDEQFAEWHKWLEQVRKDVENLVIGRHVYEEVRALVRENPSLHKPRLLL